MNHAEMKLAEILGSGRKPTADDLEAALHSVLQERNALMSINKDMGVWLARMVTARIQNDSEELVAILDEFMTAHVEVKVVENTTRRVH